MKRVLSFSFFSIAVFNKMAPKSSLKTHIQWRTLISFILYQPSDSSASEQNSLPQSRKLKLVEAQLGEKRILRIDLRHWQEEKALNGLSMSPDEARYLGEKMKEPELLASQFETENDKKLAILLEPQPMLVQVVSTKVNAMLLDSPITTRLRDLLPSLLWMIDLKNGTTEEMQKDVLMALTAIKFRDMEESPSASTGPIVDELQGLLRSKGLKKSVSKAFSRLADLFLITPSEMNIICADFFKSIDSFQDEIHEYVKDSIKNKGKGGDFYHLKKLLALLEKEENTAKKRQFSDGNRQRQKLAGEPRSKLAKRNEADDE